MTAGNVLGAYAPDGLSGEVNGNYAGHFDIIGLVEKLFYQLRPALAHSHGSQRAVAGMGIGAENHPASAGKHFPGELVDNSLMRGHIDAAVFLGTGESKEVIVFIIPPTAQSELWQLVST